MIRGIVEIVKASLNFLLNISKLAKSKTIRININLIILFYLYYDDFLKFYYSICSILSINNLNDKDKNCNCWSLRKNG